MRVERRTCALMMLRQTKVTPARSAAMIAMRPVARARLCSAGLACSEGVVCSEGLVCSDMGTSGGLLDLDDPDVEPEAERDQGQEEHDGRKLQHAVVEALEMLDERHRAHRVDDDGRRPRA